MEDLQKSREDKRRIGKRIGFSFYRAFKNFLEITPMLIGVVLLIGLFKIFVSKEMISSLFTDNPLIDTLIGSVIGSISAGNPITSYIIGGELIKQNVTLYAVTAFIVTWVAVGVIQLPFEASVLGKRFAVSRNIISFILSIAISILTVLTLNLFR